MGHLLLPISDWKIKLQQAMGELLSHGEAGPGFEKRRQAFCKLLAMTAHMSGHWKRDIFRAL